MERDEQTQFDKLIEQNKQLLAEINRFKEEKEKTPGFAEYVAKSMKMANIPTDPYSHQFQLLNSPGHKIADYNDLMDPAILLGNVADNKTMLLMQRDFYYLSRFFDMGKRSEGMLSVFNVFYHTWVGQCRMTASLQGNERNLQSFLEPSLAQAPGFGFLSRKKKKKGGKKKIMDYMTPEDEGGLY